MTHLRENVGMNCRHEALAILLETDAILKAQRAAALWQSVQALSQQSTTPSIEANASLLSPAQRAEVITLTADQEAIMPGRPAKPELVSAKEVPTRSPFTLEGRAALIHAICHIEFNAINLALDAVWRFPGMPDAFYRDWLQVAGEEAYHFDLLRAHLESLGWHYGDFAAHNGLWHMCDRTRHDILARMALVPRTLEARGLDATPPIQAKLTRAGDLKAVEILDVILRDEVGHVRIGNHWYHHLCQERGIDGVALYPSLVTQYEAPRMRPPYNETARLAAGFTPEEMAFLLGEE